MVNSYFGGMKKFVTTRPLPVKETQKKPAVLIQEKKTEQIHIALGVRGASVQSPDRYELEVLASILGGGMSSRLFSEVREKRGLAYYVRSSSDEYKDTGSLVSTAGIDPKRVKEAVEVMMQEYQKVASGTMKITEKELKKAKEYIKGHLVLELEDSRAVSKFYAHQELIEDEILNPDEVLKKVDNVTIEQVESVGQKYFVNEGLNLALIGNFSEKDALEKVLTVR